MENKKFELTEQTINQIFNYLISKPYSEVTQLIELLQKDLSTDNKVEEEKEKE